MAETKADELTSIFVQFYITRQEALKTEYIYMRLKFPSHQTYIIYKFGIHLCRYCM